MAIQSYRFIQVDVFTDTPFGGNPLAVFHQAEGLSGEDMQKLAKEMNLSETTFVLPPEQPEADFKVRIFTPTSELPFAGHLAEGQRRGDRFGARGGRGRRDGGGRGAVLVGCWASVVPPCRAPGGRR